ncbi:5055_t:CDS:1 [Ambispora gerdemannii]|uniref:5055_t:CDS:1 n=1 Tax=Ambispora gerdemannii TaxID=144530 RepID=A0A9N8W9H5_9GLOM|nr:5055_t:CDS:1 [Ambispora gerdemannii]
MKFLAILALLITATSLTIDARPTGKSKQMTISIKKDELPSSFTWKQKQTIHMNRALLKYSKNIRAAYSKGLVGQETIQKLEAASIPVSTGDTTINNSNSTDSVTALATSVNNPLSDQGNDIGYFGPIQVGGQTFNTIFDTGSSDLWVPDQNCTDPACSIHTKFDKTKSQSFDSNNNVPFAIQYGTGSVSGVSALDTISIAGAVANKQVFGLTQKMSNEFANTPFDGILGMGLDQLSAQKAKTPFTQLVEQKAVPNSVFGFFLGRKKDGTDTQSQLTLGDVDSTKFSGNINFNKLVSNTGFWEIAMDDAAVNGSSLGFKSKTAIIDTGTTLIVTPDAAAIHNQIPGAVDQDGQFFVPCNTTAIVSLAFGGASFDISSKDLARDPIGQQNLCTSGIALGQIGGPDQWLVGDTFLKNVYSAYDTVKLAVGFAPAKQKL